MSLIKLLVFILFFSVQSCLGFESCRRNTTGLKLINNGFEEIIIWIGEEVNEDYQMIEDLKKLLEEASQQLYTTTRQRAFFRNVSIFLPRDWGHPPEELHDQIFTSTFPATESPARAHFWIRNRSPRSAQDSLKSWALGDEEAVVPAPYVIKTTPCGFPGKYVRLTSEFIRFGSKVSDILGEPKKRIVREFAKLRWGVYDEVAAESLSQGHYYLHTDLSVKPIACSTAVKGDIVDNPESNEKCDRSFKVNNPSCLFEPYKTLSRINDENKKASSTVEEIEENTPYGSLMYRSDLSYIEHFCDTATESGETLSKELNHNNEAPTVHNLHCNGKSIWQVMREHDDFINGNNPPMSAPRPPPTNFKLIEKPDRRVVLVIDTSTSMNFLNRLNLMRQAASHFIDILPNNTWVAIVCFSSRAVIKQNLIEIVHDDVRTQLKRRLPKRLVEGTSIGSGISKALEALKTTGPKHMQKSGGSILVLTDGKEHNTPKINDTLEEVLDFGVRVNTIAFGPNVATELEYLAQVTGGQTYFASSGEFSNSNELRESFTASVEDKNENMVVIASDTLKIRPNTSYDYEFFVDDTIGKETRITILYKDTIAPIIGIKSPLVEIWEVEGKDRFMAENMTFFVKVEEEFNKKMIYVPGEIPTGTWTLMIKNLKVIDVVEVRVSVLSQARDKKEDVLHLSPALLCRSVDYTGTEVVVIYAHLSVGELAVLDARVLAEITRPLTNLGMVDTSVVQLWDNGFGADVIPHDGVYSGYFNAFTLKGRYSVKVFSDYNGGRARLTPVNILGIGVSKEKPAIVNTRYLISNLTKTEKPKNRQKRALFDGFLPPFQRTSSSAGAFSVQLWDADGVICPESYTLFQDSCYKVYRLQMLSQADAKKVCKSDGGYLAIIETYQELSWIMDRISRFSTWFGGILKKLLESGELNIEVKTERDRRGEKDEDLWALTALLNRTSNTSERNEAVESFAPDLGGMTQKEVDSIAKYFGVATIENVEVLKHEIAQKTQEKIKERKRRAADEGSGGMMAPGQDPFDFSLLDLLQTTAETLLQNVTLSPAKMEPAKPFPGNTETDCSWFQQGHIVQSSGEACVRRRIFICERNKIDLTPPSRITDLRAYTNASNNDVVTLVWSAPGDDLTYGTASRYEFRTLSTASALRQLTSNFSSGELVSDKSFLVGSVEKPQEFGMRESFVLNIPSIASCPSHAAIDLFVIIPQRSLGDIEQIEAIVKLMDSITRSFIISHHDLSVSIISSDGTKGRWLIKHSARKEEIILSINNEEVQNKIGVLTEENIEDIVSRFSGLGRRDVPKMAVVISDSSFDKFVNYTTMTDAMMVIVSVGFNMEMSVLYDMASDPKCRNTIVVEGWRDLATAATGISRQLCYSRVDGYQAIGVVAVDEVDLRSDPSNIASFVVKNPREEVICDPLPTLPPAVAVASGLTLTTTLAIAVPLAVILSIIGVVILFGQVRKWKRKRDKAKEEKEEAERVERLKKDPKLQAIRNQLRSSTKRKGSPPIRSNKTAPMTPPV